MSQGSVNALAIFDGKLIAAGGFGTAGGVIVNNIATWDGSTWSALGSGTNDEINSLIVYNGLLFAGVELLFAGELGK